MYNFCKTVNHEIIYIEKVFGRIVRKIHEKSIVANRLGQIEEFNTSLSQLESDLLMRYYQGDFDDEDSETDQ
jgi:hypothetical protein